MPSFSKDDCLRAAIAHLAERFAKQKQKKRAFAHRVRSFFKLGNEFVAADMLREFGFDPMTGEQIPAKAA